MPPCAGSAGEPWAWRGWTAGGRVARGGGGTTLWRAGSGHGLAVWRGMGDQDGSSRCVVIADGQSPAPGQRYRASKSWTLDQGGYSRRELASFT
jgi:hypothetical protein